MEKFPELLLALEAWLRAVAIVVGVNGESAKIVVVWGGQKGMESRSNIAVQC